MHSIRAASQADADFLVPLVIESSGGVWPALWREYATTGETVHNAGARYLANTDHSLSVVNAVIAESESHRLGAMICYREGRQQEHQEYSQAASPFSEDLYNALRPYRALSDADSLFIAELCLLPLARGQGIGGSLLQHAKEAAVRQGLPKLTLRVFSTNVGAIRLYERFGFSQTRRLPVAAHPDIKVSGTVVLMTLAL